MARKILITDDLHPLLQQGLEQDGFTVDYRPAITEKEVLEIIGDYEGLVINSKVYAGKELLDKATQLKFVCRAGSGLEVIDLPYAKEKNIAAFNSPEGNRNSVAEQALGMLLNLMNNISKAHYEVRNKQWIREANRGYELSGKTIGLIAYGHTAQAFAKILRGFDVKVLAYDKYKTGFSDDFVAEATLEEIYKQAEIVSVHLPLTEETKHMIDYGFLSSFNRPFWLINTSRGKVLRTADLIKTLEEGKVTAAALDVLENEKLETLSTNEQEEFNQLIQHNRILLTPHIAGWTHESKRRIAEVLLEKIRKVYAHG
ncbi:MAG TPA: NAD(P)-dependent oxidoreductase [Chitinophagales bacterium]|nr:NAD(P)-dependent oxidoreductase [Chitinophagales bacterium]